MSTGLKDDMKAEAEIIIDNFENELRSKLGDILGKALDPADRDALLDYLLFWYSHSMLRFRQIVPHVISEHVPDSLRYRE